jgi:hypothetical protein
VSYQFLTDPIELDWTGKPKGEVPEWSDRWMTSNRIEDRLVSVQVAAARLDAGLDVPPEFGPMVSRWLSESPLPVLRRALVSTSLRLKRPEDIPTLLQIAENDGPLGAVIESQLMGWNPAALEEVWRKRVSEGTALSPSMHLALEGLASLGKKEDLPAIEAVMENHPEATVRREAAAAIGRIDPNRGKPHRIPINPSTRCDRLCPGRSATWTDRSNSLCRGDGSLRSDREVEQLPQCSHRPETTGQDR